MNKSLNLKTFQKSLNLNKNVLILIILILLLLCFIIKNKREHYTNNGTEASAPPPVEPTREATWELADRSAETETMQAVFGAINPGAKKATGTTEIITPSFSELNYSATDSNIVTGIAPEAQAS